MSQNGYADNIISEAQSLIEKVSGDLRQSADVYSSLGINPDKVLSACEPVMGDKQRDELAKLLAQDQEAIQREVDEGAARFRFATAPASTARKPRSMI
jgi:dsDNA-binding SOS-regulon protein